MMTIVWVMAALTAVIAIPQAHALVPEWAPEEAKVAERIAEIEVIVAEVRREIPQYYPEAIFSRFTDTEIATSIHEYEKALSLESEPEFTRETVEWNAFSLLTFLITDVPLPNWEALIEMYWQIRFNSTENMSPAAQFIHDKIRIDYSSVMNAQLPHDVFITPEMAYKLLETESLVPECATTVPPTCSYKTEDDDGYVYPENATDTEKAKIDSQERYLWEKADRPGEPTTANPYCDLLSPEERNSVVCHDRKDASETTGLYTCNDFSHVENWTECKDVSGYEYAR